MHTVTPDAALAALSEEDVRAALDRYDARCEHESEADEETSEEESPIDDPITREVARLVTAYAERFDRACRDHGHIPEEVLLYRPKSAIERAAFHIFTQALHDSLQDADDE